MSTEKYKYPHTAQSTACTDKDSVPTNTIFSTKSTWLVRLTVRATKMSQRFSPLTLFSPACKKRSGKRSPSFSLNDHHQCLASRVLARLCIIQLKGELIPLWCSTINVHGGAGQFSLEELGLSPSSYGLRPSRRMDPW